MPTKREDRPRRNRLTDEALSLFRRLDAVPDHERNDVWQKESRRLAVLLGPMGDKGEDFESAWFMGGLDVLDPGSTGIGRGIGDPPLWCTSARCASSYWRR
jgi:hypothetical protein